MRRSECSKDLPYKIELNKWGNIEMSPARNRHGEFQVQPLAYLLQLENAGRRLYSHGVCDSDDRKC